MTPLADRIAMRLNALGKNAKQASKEAKLNETYVRDLLKGKSRNPNTQHIEKLAIVLGCSANDLLHGPREALHRPSGSSRDGVAEIPEFGAFVAMGGPGLDEDHEVVAQWQFPAGWLRHETRSSPESLLVITLEGDSMTPTLAPGDKVLVDSSRKLPSPPGLFILFDGIGMVAKRIEPVQGSDPPRLRIISDNSRHKPYERLMDEVNIIGRIMARWQRLS